MYGRKIMLLAALFAAIVPAAAEAADLPTGFVEEVVADGLSGATAMAFAPDGRLFILEQDGAVRIARNGATLPNPFIQLQVDGNGERGLLGIAFDPQFATNGHVYLYYTTTSGGAHNRLSRFTAAGDTAVPGSEVVLLDLPRLSSAQNHNGGAIHFGPDGMLYVATGDNATGSNSQSMTTTLGKILRLSPDGSIPANNPFFSSTTGQNRAIWALGLRNPYTFAFQPGTGVMYINDVGQNTWEEIDVGRAGANYGWPATEGPTTNPAYVTPLYAYQHDTGSPTGCAITGGAFYNPPQPQYPSDYVGSYFFADFCGGWIYRLDSDATTTTAVPFASAAGAVVDLQAATNGDLHYLVRNEGRVYRIRYAGDGAPAIVTGPQDVSVAVGADAVFTVSASGTAPLSYQWLRDGVEIAGATQASYTLPAVAATDNGATFAVRVTNALGSTTSVPARLSVVFGEAPVATITTPAEGTFYRGGATITYAGTGIDPEDGVLAPTALTWGVDFHHDDHSHPVLAPHSGVSGGSFTVPVLGETSTNVFYRITLQVVDSNGQVHTATRDVLPQIVTLRVRTSPPGLTVTIDGQPARATVTFDSVTGVIRTLGTTATQIARQRTWRFVGWSDGGALVHDISTPAADSQYVARFRLTGRASLCVDAPTSLFTDTAGSYATADIACLAWLGLSSGVTPTTYAPTATVTRGQMAAFLMRMYETLLGDYEDSPATAFADADGHFAAADINALHALGISSGTGPTSFSPDAPVTRGAMAVFLVRLWEAVGQPPLPAGPAFADTAGSYAHDAATALVGAGIAAGCEPDRFCPDAPLTREQMAVLLVGVLDAAFIGP